MSKQTIQFSYPVESINRKMTLRRNTASSLATVYANGESTTIVKPVARYMGSGERKVFVNGLGYVSTNYLFVRFNKRGTAVSADELAQRSNFGNASKLASRWKKDMATVATSLQVFQNKGSRGGVTSVGKSYAGWMFQIAYSVIDGGGTVDSPFPAE